MNVWKRIPHQFVLAFAFGVIAIGLAAAIIFGATSALADADRSIAYATAELEGIRYLARTHAVLHELLAYRAELLRARVRASPGTARRHGSPFHPQTGALAASIGLLGDGSATPASLAPAILPQRAALVQAWSSMLPVAGVLPTPEQLSAVIATVQPLLAGIAGDSGISNDPTADGQNFGDAALRFALSLARGSEAASIAADNLATRNGALGQRFSAARLLAQAQTAIAVGRQDAEDEIELDPVNGPPLVRQASANVRDFEQLRDSITKAYVESSDIARTSVADTVLAAELERFTASSFTVIGSLRQNLSRVTQSRIDQARRQQGRVVAGTIAGISLEFMLLLVLARVSIGSYQNQRKRLAAERMALEAQRTGLAQFQAVFDRAPTGMIIVDRQCRILDVNEAAHALLDPAGAPVSAPNLVADHQREIEQIFSGATDLHAQERNYLDPSGRSAWFHVSISAVPNESEPARIVILMIRDITDGKSMEEQLVFEAGHDALTGLPNRKLFLTLLQQALDDRERDDAPGVFSVIFIDFNDFKTINDSFGHQAGDKFLIDGAARLRDSVRSTDVVARIGGDEFAVILHGMDCSEIEKSVMRLQAVVSVPVHIEGQLVASSASFGIAEAEPSYLLAAEIIRDADTAMYQAKSHGGRKYVVFDVSMREQVVRRMQLSIDIVSALEHDEMQLLYQPIVDLQDGTVAGCEALLRWRRRDGSLIPPTEFLPLAEENGSIIEIGHWVTTTACEQMRIWNEQARAGKLPGLRDDFVIHVNLAVPEVHHVDLLSHLKGTLQAKRVGARQIILEITEGIVLKNTDQLRSTLAALSDEGFRLCIDDFGTGYSSLRYLNDLPLHCFKIDRSFVSNGNGGLANASIVEMLMVLSRSLGLTVVAEGIETREQSDALRSLGCRYGQGYFFAPALDAPVLTTILEEDRQLQPMADRLSLV